MSRLRNPERDSKTELTCRHRHSSRSQYRVTWCGRHEDRAQRKTTPARKRLGVVRRGRDGNEIVGLRLECYRLSRQRRLGGSPLPGVGRVPTSSVGQYNQFLGK